MNRSFRHPISRLRYRRLALCLIFALLTLHTDSSPVLACSVGPGYIEATIAERVHAADFVLEGTADVFDKTARDTGATATFTVHRWFKGNGPARVTISEFGVGSDCYSPIPGGKAILFATSDPATGVMRLHYTGVSDAVITAYPPNIAEVVEAVRIASTLPKPTSTIEPAPVVNVVRPQPCWLESIRCMQPASLVGFILIVSLLAFGLGLFIWKHRESTATLWQKLKRLIRTQRRAVGCSVFALVAMLIIGLGISHLSQQRSLPLSCLPNCAFADLRQADLSEIDLSGSNLSHARLDGAYLWRTNLSGANLTGSSLQRAELYGSNLSQAVLRNADLTYASLSMADLRGTDLRGANLNKAELFNIMIDDTTQLDDKWRLAEKIINEGMTDRSLQKVNLSDTNLYGRELSNVDLTEVNLSGATLQGTRWITVTLDRADLHEAILAAALLSEFSLREANLAGADLRDVSLRGCDIDTCDLSGANLQQANLDYLQFNEGDAADFRGANLRGASLNGVDLRGLTIDAATQLDEKWRRIWEIINLPQVRRNLPGADLRWSYLQGANLREAELSAANLFRADLTQADLRGANLRRANLQGTVLSDADLSGADLRDADLRWVDLAHANLENVLINDNTQMDKKWLLAWEIVNRPQTGRDLAGVDLSWTNLSGANLVDANLSGADLSNTYSYATDLKGANLSEANISDARWGMADLSGVDFSHARLCKASFSDTNLKGANLKTAFPCDAYFGGARYDGTTIWPYGFDPVAAGANIESDKP